MTARAKRKAVLGALLGLTFLAAPRLALAHAPAQATQLSWPSNGGRNDAVIRTNRGVVFAGERSAGFEFLCNEAYESPVAETPPLAVRSDGSVLVASYELGLVVGSADRCGLTPVEGELSGINLIALKPDPAVSDGFYALTLPADGSTSAVFHAAAGSDDWQRLARVEGAPSSLEIARSMPARLYVVSMRSEGETQVADVSSSSDSAETFEVASSLALDSTEVRAYLAGVDPRDPARLFLRTQSFDGVSPERLLSSEDAGRTFTELFSAAGPLSVAVGAGGEELWVGGAEGIWRSEDGGVTFTERSIADLTRIGCLTERDGELFACAYRAGEFGVLVSNDDGNSWEWYARMSDVAARPACSAQSAEGRSCEAPFRHFKDEVALGASALGGGAGAAPMTGAAGESSASGSAGTASSGGGAGGSDAPAAPKPEVAESGCALSGNSAPRSGHDLAFGAILLAGGCLLVQRLRARATRGP